MLLPAKKGIKRSILTRISKGLCLQKETLGFLSFVVFLKRESTDGTGREFKEAVSKRE